MLPDKVGIGAATTLSVMLPKPGQPWENRSNAEKKKAVAKIAGLERKFFHTASYIFGA